MEMSTATSSLGDEAAATLATMASAREAAMKEAVEQLQAGLLWLPHPDKVLKYMKRLHDLPMTVNVLAETGIGKLVNSLCKYEEVGAMARNIVGRWKALVSAEEDFDSDSDRDLVWEEQSFERSRSRKRPHGVYSKEEDWQKSRKYSSSQPPSPTFRERKHPNLLEEEKSPRASSSSVSENREGRKQWDQPLSPDHSSSSQDQSEPSGSDEQPHPGCSSLQGEGAQKFGEGSDPHTEDKEKTIEESQLEEPSQVKPRSLNDSKRHRPLHEKEKCLLDFEKQKKMFDLDRENLPATSEEMCQQPSSGTDTIEKQSSAPKTDKDKESCSVKKHLPPKESHFVKHLSKTKHLDAPTSKPEKNQPNKDVLDVGNWLKDKSVSQNVQTQEGKSKPPTSHKSTESCLLQSGPPEPCDKDEEPTTSHGSNSSQPWQPQRKSSMKIPNVVHEDKGHVKDNSAKTDSGSPGSLQKLSKMNSRLNKEQSANVLAKLKSITSRITPRSGNYTSVPKEQESGQLTAFETSLPSEPKKKKTSSYHEEEEIGFTGRRTNTKMHVYSGPKCVYQPRIISLHQQCIRVLNNNLDSIFDIGGVPYTVLEPVLEKCTPKQLHRIEEYNHFLIEESDQLWKIHCNRDFRKEKPKESESWRELYLRLQEAREQRLLLLTENIRSAHANKPKGRQTMLAFVNSVAKPPRDIRKKQEKFGTGRVAIPEVVKTKPALHTPATGNSSNDVQTLAGSSTSSIYSTSSAGSSGSCDSRKTPGKKIAPMMAKTIKAFKNRFSR